MLDWFHMYVSPDRGILEIGACLSLHPYWKTMFMKTVNFLIFFHILFCYELEFKIVIHKTVNISSLGTARSYLTC